MIDKLPNKLFVMFCIVCFSKLVCEMLELFFIFYALFLRTKSRG